MDPSKKIGQIKEQVELENISRRRYPDKWGKLTEKDANRFYNPDEVNKNLRTINDRNVNKEIWPYVYTGHGDSYFVSKDMYESLVAKCRCGRQRTEGHTIKCLQKLQSKYFNDDSDDTGGAEILPSSSSSPMPLGDGDGPSKGRTQVKHDSEAIATNDAVDSSKSFYGGSQNHHPDAAAGKSRRRIPQTSNGMIGWPRSRFSELEQSAKYVSPVTKMHGYKMTETPYSVIFIG